ncbi:MAG: hypothetical protein SFV54_10890 [Bryobacteraceae bacterium]|nr:hypothetical protein [Bryobacteraceae bacterium]
MRRYLWLALLAVPSVVPGQNFEPPLAGFLFDSQAKVIVPVLGMPGGATLGPSLISGVDAAWFAPGSRRVLAVIDGVPRLIRNLADPHADSLALDLDRAEKAAWSPNGRAVVVSAGSRLLLVVLEPALRMKEIDLSGFGTVISLALSDELDVAASVSEGANGSLVWIAHAQQPAAVASFESPVQLSAFTLGGSLVAVDAACRLYMLEDLKGGGRLVREPSSCDSDSGSGGPLIASDRRGARVLVVTASSVLSYDRSAGEWTELSRLAYPVTGLQELSSPGLWGLSGPRGPGAPAWIVDARGDTVPVPYFVPEANVSAQAPAATTREEVQ